MTNFADCAHSKIAKVLANDWIAKDTMRVRLETPEMTEDAVPGMFFMLRNSGGNDPLIGRALALYDLSHEEGWVDLVYLVKGKLTTSISRLVPGALLGIWGPLGNGFTPTPCEHLIMVAGGIGQTPFLCLAREALGKQQFGHNRPHSYASKVSFCYGVRRAEYLAGLDQFRASGCDVLVASEDGSQPDGSNGRAERVTDSLNRLLDADSSTDTRIVCCGPEPMMEAVAAIAADRDVPCQVSLETPMACGIGICFTCVAKIGSKDDWDYKRTCVEGPVFEAHEILWH